MNWTQQAAAMDPISEERIRIGLGLLADFQGHCEASHVGDRVDKLMGWLVDQLAQLQCQIDELRQRRTES